MKPCFFLFPAVLFPFPAQALSVNVSVGTPPLCNYFNGSLNANVNGGVPPYFYSWVGPNGYTADIEDIAGLESGTYTLTVTDFEGTVATDDATLVPTVYEIEAYQLLPPFCEGTFFPFGQFHSEQIYQQYGNIPTWNFLVNDVPAYSDMGSYTFSILDAPGTAYTYTFADDQGCTGTITGMANYEVEWPTVQLLAVEPACSGWYTGGFSVGIGPEGHQQWLSWILRDADGDFVSASPAINGAEWIGQGPIIMQFDELLPGDYMFHLRIYYQSTGTPTECESLAFQVTVPNDPGCGNVSGRVYADYDENCVQNSEPDLPGVVLEFTPGPYFATTDAQGDYSANLPLGTYTITQQISDFAQHCPPPPATVTISGPPVTQDLADTALVPMDVSLAIASGPARPGFELHYAIDLDALTAAASGGLQLALDFDPAVSYLSASPTPANVVGSTITWNLSQLSYFGHRDVSVRLQVPPDIGLVGTVLNASASVTTTNTDAEMVNNSASTAVTVTASLDPNDKQVLTSSRYSTTQYFIGTDEWLDYTIRFQNTGTDTAFTVIIRDTLSSDLDPSTIQWGAASHTCVRAVGGEGLLTFSFFHILLPDSNVNEPGSHGFVSFRIRPRQPVQTGTVISNAADIYFDFNPPVHTNDAVLTAETSTGIGAPSGNIAYRAIVDGDRLTLHALNDRHFGSLHLLSADGRSVRSYGQMVIDPAGTPLPIAGLGAGPYLLSIIGEKGSATSVRFVKL